MTPQELGRALAEEMRKQAIVDRDIAKTHARNAMDFQQQADNSRRLTEHFRAMADGWEQTADKLASGAITLGDAETLAAVRGGLADAHEAIDPQPPFAQQRKLIGTVAVSATESLPVWADLTGAAPLPEARGFELDDVVNVCDPEHDSFGARGVVVTIRSDGWTTVMTGSSGGEVLTLPASSLMLHTTFVAQMAEAEAAAQAEDDARLAEAADFAAAAEPGIEVEL